MSDPQQPNPGGQQRQINLQQMAQQFMAGLQRHFDMLAFNLASRERADEERYKARVAEPKIMPAVPLHSNFEQMQAYAHDLLQRQVIGDSINLAVTCLNNCHFFLLLVKTAKDQGKANPDVQPDVHQTQQAFVQAQIDQKFNRLEEDFGVMCELEDTLTSLAFCMQAFLQQGGVVKEPQIDSQGKLEIELKAAKEELAGELQLQPGNLEARTLAFREGEKIAFGDVDLQRVLVTVAVFSQQLFQSVAAYAHENRPQG